MPTLTVIYDPSRPYYLLEVPGKRLTSGGRAVVITAKTERARSLTAKGSQVFCALVRLELGPQLNFNDTKLRIYVRDHDDLQLQKTVDALRGVIGDVKVTTEK